MAAEMATLGTIVKAVGLKGEVKLLPGPDFWSAALSADELDLVTEDKLHRLVHVDGFRTKGGTYILRLSGIDTIDEAEAIVGCRLNVSLKRLDESTKPQKHMPFQVMGLEVRLPDGSSLGKVVDMLLGPTQNCFIVEKGEDRYLVPDVPAVVRRILLNDRIIEINPPKGLLDLRW